MHVADGDVIPVGSIDVDVVLPDGHVAEGCPTGTLECRHFVSIRISTTAQTQD